MSRIAENTSIGGIFAGDIIIRTAIKAGIEDLRANPYLLEYCFANLVQDELTRDEYGRKEIDNAIKWFLETEFPIGLDVSLNEDRYPCIVVEMLNGEEKAATLGDVHYDTSEDVELYWPKLAGPLTPASIDTTTGWLTFSSFNTKNIIVKNMLLVLGNGKQIDILEVDGTNIRIDISDTNNIFTDLSIRPQKPYQKIGLESVQLKENYRVQILVGGEPSQANYLFSIVLFILLRYKEIYLEKRDFQCTNITYSPLTQWTAASPQIVFTRFINLSGLVTAYWPKAIYDKIQQVKSQPKIAELTLNPKNPENEAVIGEGDSNPDIEITGDDVTTWRF